MPQQCTSAPPALHRTNCPDAHTETCPGRSTP
jgi:hypothetical protein